MSVSDKCKPLATDFSAMFDSVWGGIITFIERDYELVPRQLSMVLSSLIRLSVRDEIEVEDFNTITASLSKIQQLSKREKIEDAIDEMEQELWSLKDYVYNAALNHVIDCELNRK